MNQEKKDTSFYGNETTSNTNVNQLNSSLLNPLNPFLIDGNKFWMGNKSNTTENLEQTDSNLKQANGNFNDSINPFLSVIKKIGTGNPSANINATEKTQKEKTQNRKSTGKSGRKSAENETELDSEISLFIAQKDGKNMRRLITTRRNIYFQQISLTQIALELDFAIEENILEVIQNNNGKLDLDTSLYFIPYDKYDKLYNELYILNGSDKVNLYGLCNLTSKLIHNHNYEEMTFKSGPKLRDDYTIDYTNEIPKSVDDLPEIVLNNLYPFQKEGVKFAIDNHARILLADEMGVGKTIQSVCIAGLYTEDWPVLIFCPGAVRSCWKNELLTWLQHLIEEEDIQIVEHSNEEIRKSAKFVILTYTLAIFMDKQLKKKNFQFVIADECHMMKNMNSMRFKRLMPIIRQSKRILMLSGTPILAKPIEGFYVIHALRPDIFFRFEPFGDRFCDPKPTKFGMDWSGQANTKELHFVISRFMIRRLKKDVIKELPPKNRQKVEIKCEESIVNKVKRYVKEKYARELEKEKQERGEDLTWSEKQKKKDAKEKSKIEEQLTFAEAYALTGLAKIHGIRDYIKYLLMNKCKFIIFAYHISVLNGIEDLLQENTVDYIRIDGQVKTNERDVLVEKFQSDEDCRVAILGITACGTGITLTAASTVLFAELYFTPAIMIQAEDRAHRIGQQHSCVNIHYLYGADTIDEIIFPRLRDKFFVVSTTIDDRKLDLGLKFVKSGVVGDFSINRHEIKKKVKIIEDEEEDFEEFKKEVEDRYNLIVDKSEIEEKREDINFANINLHNDNTKRKREDDDDFTEIETNSQTFLDHNSNLGSGTKESKFNNSNIGSGRKGSRSRLDSGTKGSKGKIIQAAKDI